MKRTNPKVGMIGIDCDYGFCWGEPAFNPIHGFDTSYQGTNNNGGNTGGNNTTTVVHTPQINNLLQSVKPNDNTSANPNTTGVPPINPIVQFIEDNKTIFLTGAVTLIVALIAKHAK